MVTVPDPEEPDRVGEGTRPDSFRETDATFAKIIAEWQAAPDAPRWPEEGEPAAAEPAPPPAEPVAAHHRPRDDEDRDGRFEDREGRFEDREGHFEPPEPPPLPVPRPRTLGGLVLLALGVLLLVRPGLLHLSGSVGIPLSLLLLTAGIGWLVLGLRSGPPPGSGWDDGAQL